MKTELIATLLGRNNIDWNKNQVLIINNNSCELTVLTNGKHDQSTFEGTVIHVTPNHDWNVGDFSDDWSKGRFVKIEGEAVAIKFYKV